DRRQAAEPRALDGHGAGRFAVLHVVQPQDVGRRVVDRQAAVGQRLAVVRRDGLAGDLHQALDVVAGDAHDQPLAGSTAGVAARGGPAERAARAGRGTLQGRLARPHEPAVDHEAVLHHAYAVDVAEVDERGLATAIVDAAVDRIGTALDPVLLGEAL